jgi:hypothetical protein
MTQTQRMIRLAQLLDDGCPEDEAFTILQKEQHEADIQLLQEN